MVWILAAGILGLCLLALFWSLAGSRAKTIPAISPDIAFYHAQLAEIRRQAEAGLIGAEEEISATAEAGRRLIAASSTKGGENAAQPGSALRRRATALLLLIGIPAITLPVYALLGSPDQPAMALADRPAPDPRLAQIAAFIAQIEERLSQNPNEPRGFELIAPLYLRLGRAEDAANAVTRLIEIAGSTPEREANLGEALVAAQNGIVSPQARAAFERAITGNPQLQKAQFYLGRAAAQAGEIAKAREIFATLLTSVKDEGPVRELVEQEIAGLAKLGEAASNDSLKLRQKKPEPEKPRQEGIP